MNKKVLNIVELVIKFLVIIVLVILIWYRVNSLDLEEKKAVEIGPGIYSKDPENVYNSEYKVKYVFDYDENMNIKNAYEWLKRQSDYECAENV